MNQDPGHRPNVAGLAGDCIGVTALLMIVFALVGGAMLNGLADSINALGDFVRAVTP